jgi:hypothetical protein
MTSKLDYILEVLEKNQFRHLKNSFSFIKEEKVRKGELSGEVNRTFSEIGGLTKEFPWKPAQWDLEFEHFAIRLDQEPSFNRYRAITLKSSIYTESNFFNLENYKRYCRQYEIECLKAARSLQMWTDKESEHAFGPSQDAGELVLLGSAKWKQRAFLEYLEDVQASLLNIKLIRVSIYDNLMVNNKIIKLDTILSSRNVNNEKYLLSYLQRRITASS